MSLEALSKLIDTPAIRRLIDKKRAAIEAVDPQRIYVENVRAFFGFPHSIAKLILDLAVREGALERRTGLLCPRYQNIIATLEDGQDPPDQVNCLVCESEGDGETHDGRDLQSIVFYRLVHKDD